MTKALPKWAEKMEPVDMDGADRLLGMSRRWLTDAIKDHPYYDMRGNKKIFYPHHIARLRGATSGMTDAETESLVVYYKALALTAMGQAGGGAPSEASRRIPRRLRSRVWERDGGVCQYCGTEGVPMHVDHVKPWSRGGKTKIGNLKLACADCNHAKYNKTLTEWEASK